MAWFENERSCGTEVRQKHILQRTRYQLEYERDLQTVFRDTSCKSFDERVLKACIDRLQVVQVHGYSQTAKRWFENQVFPYIGAGARMGQHKSTGSENWLDRDLEAKVGYLVEKIR